MVTCSKCGKELENGARFCDECGAQVFEVVFCPNCGEKMSTEFEFCKSCGANITGKTELSEGTMVSENTELLAGKNELPANVETNNIKKGGGAKKIALPIAGIVVVVLIVGFLLSSVFSGGGNENFSLYLKDDEIVYTDYTEKGSYEITSRLADGADLSGNSLAGYIALSDNGNRIFYPDRVENYSDGYTIYYRNINKPKEEPVKVDSNIKSYEINSDGTKIVYKKGSDDILYISDLSDKEKIASDVGYFSVSDDFKKIGYSTYDNSFYLWYADKEKVKLANNYDSVEYVADDLSVIYYTKDDSLYKQKEGSDDKEKILSDIYDIKAIYDTGEIYYTRYDSVSKNLWDYVEDDMADSDADIEEPESVDYPDSPKRPYRFEYDDQESYDAAKAQYDIDYEEYNKTRDQLREDYNEKYDLYREKLQRDSLRERLKEQTIDISGYSLCYFDGSKETTIADNYILEGMGGIRYAEEKAVAYASMYEQAEIEKIKLSEISSTSEVRDMVSEGYSSSLQNCIFIGMNKFAVGEIDYEYLKVAPDGNSVYYIDDIVDGCGDLYKINISNGKAGEPEMFDTDVSFEHLFEFMDDSNKLVYYKNFDRSDWKGDLYIDKTEIDYDVYVGTPKYIDDVLFYYTDWNSNKSYGTLNMFKNNKKTVIADDVHNYTTNNSGDILYLYDFSSSSETGTLMLYNNGKPKKISDDVMDIIPISNKSN